MRRFAVWGLLVTGCATLQQIVALRQVDFALAGAERGRLAGVDLSRIAAYEDLSVTDVARIGVAIARKELPLEFQLNLTGLNPADNKVTARMIRMAWSLFLNDKETIHGVLDTTYLFPPGQAVTLPLQMRLNLVEFFGGSARDLVNLAAALAGLKADSTKISLRATPTIDTPLGPISYPTPITIVSRTIGG